MNIFDSDVKGSEISTIVLPKAGSKKVCSAVLVTVRWGEVVVYSIVHNNFDR